MARRTPRLAALPVLALLSSGCLAEEPAFVDVARFALIPDSVTRLAVTVVRPDDRDGLVCNGDGTVRDAATGATAGATADLFGEAFGDRVELVGPEELTRGTAEGAVIDGVRAGTIVVFAEGFDGGGNTVARACSQPAIVAAGTTTSVDLRFQLL